MLHNLGANVLKNKENYKDEKRILSKFYSVNLKVVTLFKVTDGFGVTVTVAVLVKVELLQPFKATDMVVSTDAIDTKDIVVLVVKAGVVMVPEVP